MALAIAGLAAASAETLSFGHEHVVGGHTLHHTHFFFGDHDHHGHDFDDDHDDHGHGGAPPHRHDHPRPTVTASVVPALFQPAGLGAVPAPPVAPALLRPAAAAQTLPAATVRLVLPRGPPLSPAPPTFAI